MDIQSDNDYKTYNSKGYFVAYLSQKWVPKDKPAHGCIFYGTQGFALSVLKEYTYTMGKKSSFDENNK